MTKTEILDRLRANGIRPSPQRIAIAEHVLSATNHPSAEEVFDTVRGSLPSVSRATIYNTLNLFADHGLIKKLNLAEGRIVFDPTTEPHHHLIDAETGAIHDVPWQALTVSGLDRLTGFTVDEHQVVLRGRPEPK